MFAFSMFVPILVFFIILPSYWCYPLAMGNRMCEKSTYQGNCIALRDCPSLLKVFMNVKFLPHRYQEKIKDTQCGFDSFAVDPMRRVWVCCPYMEEEVEETHIEIDRMLADEVQIDNLHCGIAKMAETSTDDQRIDHYPWMALIEYVDIREPSRHGFNCTGTLINDRYILTAAHCVDDHSNWQPTRILLGNWHPHTARDCLYRTSNPESCLPPNSQIIKIENIFPHSKFPAERHHDIALIKMKQEVSYSMFIRPICLPFAYNLNPTNLFGHMAHYISWGQTRNLSVVTNRKIEIPLPIWNTKKCRTRYRIAERSIDLDHEICAGGEMNVDTCHGDSGGALMYAQDVGLIKVHYIVGVMVGGTKPCGLPGWPNISINVKSHLEWILNYL